MVILFGSQFGGDLQAVWGFSNCLLIWGFSLVFDYIQFFSFIFLVFKYLINKIFERLYKSFDCFICFLNVKIIIKIFYGINLLVYAHDSLIFCRLTFILNLNKLFCKKICSVFKTAYL